MSDKHINEEENEDMNKSGKVIAGVVIAAGASLAVVGGVYAYNRSQVASNEPPKAITSVVTSSSSSRASSSSDKALEEAKRSASMSAEKSSSASLSMQAQAEAAAKAEAERQAAEAAAKAQAEAEEAARKAAEEAERQAEADRQAAAARQQIQEQEQTQPSTDQGSGNQSTGGSGNWTAEDEAARAEGYPDAAYKKSFEEYAEKAFPGQEVHLATDDELREWGLL